MPAWTKVIRWVVYAYTSLDWWLSDYTDIYIDRYKLSSSHKWIAWTTAVVDISLLGIEQIQ